MSEGGKPHPSAAHQRWLVWLAALPVAYIISPLSLLALPQLKSWPHQAWWLLGLYTLSQVLPALLAPQPGLAMGLALLRTLLMLGSMAVGVQLADTRWLRALVPGLLLTFIVAGLYSGDQGGNLASLRLSHPYLTTVSLGLAGACGWWLALFLPGSLLGRSVLGLLSLATLLLSGSRGPLLAALVGSFAGLVMTQRRLVLPLLLSGALLGGGTLVLGHEQNIFALTRLAQIDTSGRDLIWADALSVARAYPVSGVGSYLLGERLSAPSEPCLLWSGYVGSAGGNCPAWLTTLGHPWRVAHNAAMQQLSETGPLGLFGLFTLLTAVLALVLTSRDGLSIAVVVGLLVSTLTDNTLIVPSPFFAELFWLVAGLQLARLPHLHPKLLTTFIAALFVLVLALPLWTLVKVRLANEAQLRLKLLVAPQKVSGSQHYTVYAQPQAVPGSYRAALRSCEATCVTLQVMPFTVTANKNPLLTFDTELRAVPLQRLELNIYPAKGGFDLRPLGQYAWAVKLN